MRLRRRRKPVEALLLADGPPDEIPQAAISPVSRGGYTQAELTEIFVRRYVDGSIVSPSDPTLASSARGMRLAACGIDHRFCEWIDHSEEQPFCRERATAIVRARDANIGIVRVWELCGRHGRKLADLIAG